MNKAVAGRRVVRWRSAVALRLAPWLADAASEESMKFYRQHFAQDGRPKRKFGTCDEAERWIRGHNHLGMRSYHCRVCKTWHITSKGGVRVPANTTAKSDTAESSGADE